MAPKKTSKKSVAKKKVAKKKTSTKKTVKKTSSVRKAIQRKKTLIIASPNKCFWIQYGPVVKDIFELQDALTNITDEQFKHHVNSIKNDFAVWVEEILGDKECAKNIKKAKSIKAMIKAVENALKHY